MENVCHVYYRRDFLGQVGITDEDWRDATHWRKAALNAAVRVFGDEYPARGLYAVSVGASEQHYAY